jgi:glycine/D-amino acid oxidase-like deaminating enzyme
MAQRVAIIGGGVIGSAVAYFTLADPAFAGEVVVIERDPTYARASSALSASSIRQQFSTPINVEIGRFGVEFLRRAGEFLEVGGERPDVGLVERGYLFLATARGLIALEASHAVQRAHGADVALLDRDALHAAFPWLATGDLAAASLGLSGEGWFDGYTVLRALRRKARALGARYVVAVATGFEESGHRIAAVRLDDGSVVPCSVAVNAAGPWARRVADWAGVDLPVHARRRCVFAFTCPTPIDRCPLVVDVSGVWFRPEGHGFICGVAPDERDDADELPLDVDHALFEARICPRAGARGRARRLELGGLLRAQHLRPERHSRPAPSGHELRARQWLLGARPPAGACRGARRGGADRARRLPNARPRRARIRAHRSRPAAARAGGDLGNAALSLSADVVASS